MLYFLAYYIISSYLCIINLTGVKYPAKLKKMDYQKQANDFLAAANASFNAKYIRTGKYFDTDKANRDIYEITLKRGARTFSFEFGQSIARTGNYIKYGVQKIFIPDNMLSRPYQYAKRLHSDVNKKTDKFVKRVAPSAYDVLACITSYDPGTLEDFCSEFGYSTDSKSAEKTYYAVLNEWLNIQRLFNDEQISKLQEIQ